MAVYTYPACFFEEDDGGYTVVFQDSLYGVTTQGDSLDEAAEKALEVLALALEEFVEKGNKPPKPEKLDMKKVNKELGGTDDECRGFINYVSLDYESYAKEHLKKSVKKTVSIPTSLDNKAKKLGLNFSRILQEGLAKEIKKKEKEIKKKEKEIKKKEMKKKEKEMKKVG